MRTRLQYLLDKLGEELNEVAVRANKAIDFGLNEIEPGQELTNLERLQQEFTDLIGVAQMLDRENGTSLLVSISKAKELEEKRLKVNKYYEYCKSLKTVE